MSVVVMVMVLALTGQVAGDSRYGNPFGDQPAAEPPANDEQDSPPADAQTGSPYRPHGSAAVITNDDRLDAGSAVEETAVKPSAMIRQMLTAPSGARLTGRSVTLAEVVAGARSRANQSQRVDAYWDLCSSVADYYVGLREQEELQRLKKHVTNVGPAWQQAESELGLRLGTSQRAAMASQYRLANLIGQVDANSLPLPADLPHCGDYYSRYERVFAGRRSAEAEQLSELLPLRYEELKDAAAAVVRAEEWLDAVAARRIAGSDAIDTLRAWELLALRRLAFVQIVCDYNHRIARYAELASPGPIDTDRLIGMLIRRGSATSTASRSSTAAGPSNRQSQNLPATPPATFTEGWTPVDQRRRSAARRDESLEPASAKTRQTLRKEHSLLVPSK